MFLGRVRPIHQKRELEMAIGIAQVMDFQTFQILLQARGRREQRGHDHESSAVLRNPGGKIKLRQHLRTERIGDEAIDEGDREVRGRDERQNRKGEESQRTHAREITLIKRNRQEKRRDQSQRT